MSSRRVTWRQDESKFAPVQLNSGQWAKMANSSPFREFCMVGLKDRRIQKVLDILENNPRCGISELAEGVNLSRSRLEHLFKEQIGIHLRDYILECRLKTAAELLKSTDMSVKEIAHMAGYEHS